LKLSDVIRYLFFLILFIAKPGALIFCQQAELSGRLYLDSTWLPRIYISQIPDFNSMFTASGELIMAEGSIDSLGNFSIGFAATQADALYRAHIIKKNDPVSTLIIGSNDENHFFFIAAESSRISLLDSDSENLIRQDDVTGNSATDELNTLLSTLKRQALPRQKLKDSLINLADKNTSELVSLMAIHYSFGLNNKQRGKIKNTLSRFNKTNPYGNRIFAEYLKPDNRYIYLLIIVSALILVFFGYRVYKQRKAAKISMMLSHREASIARFILNGNTNKEIAIQLNIELSTVKTHVNNIYTKLKVANRKGLSKYKHIFVNRNK
jgi:DNA-binding CsgD family transcriptional regulator